MVNQDKLPVHNRADTNTHHYRFKVAKPGNRFEARLFLLWINSANHSLLHNPAAPFLTMVWPLNVWGSIWLKINTNCWLNNCLVSCRHSSSFFVCVTYRAALTVLLLTVIEIPWSPTEFNTCQNTNSIKMYLVEFEGEKKGMSYGIYWQM